MQPITKHLQHLNLAPAPQELKHCVTGEENEFVKARANMVLTLEPLENVKSVLRYCMLKVGVRAANLPTEEEKAVLINHIQEFYGGHTLAEIKLAFDMAIAGKLDLQDKDVVCYENFSCLYFSSIMNAYRRWASSVHRQVVKEPVKELPAPEITDKDRLQWVDEWFAAGHPVELMPVEFYDYLQLTNFMDYVEQAAEFVKKQIDDSSEYWADKLRKQQEFARMEKEGFTGTFKTLIINHSKRLAVRDRMR